MISSTDPRLSNWLLYLDPRNRAVVTAGPPGSIMLATDGLIEVEVSYDDWLGRYQDALAAAHQAGQDLAVAEDGSTAQVPHIPTATELRRQALSTLMGNPAPSNDDIAAAVKTLIAGGTS